MRRSSTDMRVEEIQFGTTLVMVVSGRVDASSAAEFETRLAAWTRSSALSAVVLEVADLTYVASSALGHKYLHVCAAPFRRWRRCASSRGAYHCSSDAPCQRQKCATAKTKLFATQHTSGLRAMLQAARTLAARSGRFMLCAPSANLRSLLKEQVPTRESGPLCRPVR